MWQVIPDAGHSTRPKSHVPKANKARTTRALSIDSTNAGATQKQQTINSLASSSASIREQDQEIEGSKSTAVMKAQRPPLGSGQTKQTQQERR